MLLSSHEHTESAGFRVCNLKFISSRCICTMTNGFMNNESHGSLWLQNKLKSRTPLGFLSMSVKVKSSNCYSEILSPCNGHPDTDFQKYLVTLLLTLFQDTEISYQLRTSYFRSMNILIDEI